MGVQRTGQASATGPAALSWAPGDSTHATRARHTKLHNVHAGRQNGGGAHDAAPRTCPSHGKRLVTPGNMFTQATSCSASSFPASSSPARPPAPPEHAPTISTPPPHPSTRNNPQRPDPALGAPRQLLAWPLPLRRRVPAPLSTTGRAHVKSRRHMPEWRQVRVRKTPRPRPAPFPNHRPLASRIPPSPAVCRRFRFQGTPVLCSGIVQNTTTTGSLALPAMLDGLSDDSALMQILDVPRPSTRNGETLERPGRVREAASGGGGGGGSGLR